MPGEQNEVLGQDEVQPVVETPEMASIRQRLDKAAARARRFAASCSGDEPHLGLATTEQLIEELYARMRVQLAQPQHLLDLHYRTVDGDGIDITREVTGEEDGLLDRASDLVSEANKIIRSKDPAREAQRG
jgi:hypothetical protein